MHVEQLRVSWNHEGLVQLENVMLMWIIIMCGYALIFVSPGMLHHYCVLWMGCSLPPHRAYLFPHFFKLIAAFEIHLIVLHVSQGSSHHRYCIWFQCKVRHYYCHHLRTCNPMQRPALQPSKTSWIKRTDRAIPWKPKQLAKTMKSCSEDLKKQNWLDQLDQPEETM